MEQFTGFIAIAASFIFFSLYLMKIQQNKKFKNSTLIEGRIVALQRAAGGENSGYYPTIEYNYLGNTVSFKNTLTIHGASVGQKIDIQVTTDGDARVETAGDSVVSSVLLLISLIGTLFGLFLIFNGGL